MTYLDKKFFNKKFTIRNISRFNFSKIRVPDLVISTITALAILPFLTVSSKQIASSIVSGNEALGIFYYPRIFSARESWTNIGNYFTESVDKSISSAEFVMLGDLIERIFFKLFSENVAITYAIVSAIYLTLWIYILSLIVSNKVKKDFLESNIIIAAVLVIFFGNNSFFNENYGFFRLISPQVSILIWILGIYCISKYYEHGSLVIKRIRFLVLFSTLILLSSMTYLFSFLALTSVSAVLIVHLFYYKRFKDLIIFLISFLISLMPFLSTTYMNYNDVVFTQVLERMGLFESRLPGTIKTATLCLLVAILTYFYTKFTKTKLNRNPFVLSILICTSGLMLASQSNLITNKSIQFYHFETFSYILLILLITKILLLFQKRIIGTKVLKRNTKSVLFSIVSGLVVLGFIQTSIKQDPPSELKQFFSRNFSESQNLIVDVSVLDYSIPIYAKSKVLYQGDIIAYKFSNTEIMKRYFVSTGCANSISFETIPGLIDYRVQPLLQKGSQINKYLSLINLDHRFENLYQTYFKEAQARELLIKSQINEFMRENIDSDCIQLARQFGIDYVVYDLESNWVENIAKENTAIFTVNNQKFLVAKIS
jgi:hypothetical protein